MIEETRESKRTGRRTGSTVQYSTVQYSTVVLLT